jgi:hypothetical protein
MAQSNRNAQTKNISQAGNIFEHHLKAKNLIAKNDGVRKYTQRTTTAHDQQCPFQENELTRIAITHKDHHITHIADTFISMRVAFDLVWSANDWAGFGNDDGHLCKIFFGYKFAGEILQRVWIYCNGRETGYEQSEEGRQCFAMRQSLDANTVKGQKNTSTSWNDVANYSDIVCGLYINQSDLLEGKPITVNMDLVIPLFMLAEFQALDFYPNMIGQLEMALYVQSKYAVWAVLDPRKVADVKNFFEDAPSGVKWDKLNEFNGGGLPISRKFAQIGNPLTCITKFEVETELDPDHPENFMQATIETGQRRLICTGCRVVEMLSNISGFKTTQRTLESLREIYQPQAPWRIPAEYLEYYAFPTPPDSNGLHATTQITVHNVKDIYVMFPVRANDYTVFENPMIDNFYIKILGQQYPERTYDTLSPRFYQNMIMACDLDGSLKPTKDFIDSYTMRKNEPNVGANAGRRYKNTLRDNTNFALVIQTERNQSGFVFDGIDSQGQSVPIEIHFNPLFSGETKNTYYYYDADNLTAHPPPPQIWLCTDAYWSADIVNGLVWHKGDRKLPPEVDTDEII